MGLFSKFKKQPQNIGRASYESNTNTMAMSIVAANGSYFHLEPPKEDFDPVTKQANPWELTSSELNQPLYICNPWMTQDPNTGQYQSFADGSDLVFRVMNDNRNPAETRGGLGRAEGITDLRYELPLYMQQNMPSVAQQKIDATPVEHDANHMYLIRTGHSAYTISAEQGRNGLNWYLDGGNDRQMFAHVKIDDPFDVWATDPKTGVYDHHKIGDNHGCFKISADAPIDAKYRGMVVSTSTIQDIIDYNTLIGEACEYRTREACDYPMDMQKFAPINGCGFIGSRTDYERALHGGFSISASSMQREQSGISKPGILVTTKSGSQYGFEPTRDTNVWHMVDNVRGATYEIAPLSETYQEINAVRALRGEPQAIIGAGSPVYFEVLDNEHNIDCPLKRGHNHTSTVESVLQYEPKWMERDRMADNMVSGMEMQQAGVGYDFGS